MEQKLKEFVLRNCFNFLLHSIDIFDLVLILENFQQSNLYSHI